MLNGTRQLNLSYTNPGLVRIKKRELASSSIMFMVYCMQTSAGERGTTCRQTSVHTHRDNNKASFACELLTTNLVNKQQK